MADVIPRYTREQADLEAANEPQNFQVLRAPETMPDGVPELLAWARQFWTDERSEGGGVYLNGQNAAVLIGYIEEFADALVAYRAAIAKEDQT